MSHDAQIATRLIASDFMTRDPLILRPEMKLTDAVQKLAASELAAAVVVSRDNEVVGLLSAKECMLAVRGAFYFATTPQFVVADVMSTPVETVAPDTPLVEIAERFSQRPYALLPVCFGTQLVGELRRQHVLVAYITHIEGIAGAQMPASPNATD